MERLWLIELLPVLSTILVGVEVGLGGPRSRIPKCRVHSVARAIVVKCLSRTIQILFVLNMRVEFPCNIVREFARRLSASHDRARLSFWVNKRSSESGLVRGIFRVIVGMSEGLGFGTISPRSSVQSVISDWNMLFVKSKRAVNFTFKFSRFYLPCGAHGLELIINNFRLEDVSGLFGESLLKKGVSLNNRSVAGITRHYTILSLNRFKLNNKLDLTYPIRHIVITCSVHVI